MNTDNDVRRDERGFIDVAFYKRRGERLRRQVILKLTRSIRELLFRLVTPGSRGLASRSGAAMSLPNAAGYLASALVVLAFCMREIIPLRLAALASNIAFLAYGIALGLSPVWLLHAILLPINGWRLWQAICARRNDHYNYLSNDNFGR